MSDWGPSPGTRGGGTRQDPALAWDHGGGEDPSWGRRGMGRGPGAGRTRTPAVRPVPAASDAAAAQSMASVLECAHNAGTQQPWWTVRQAHWVTAGAARAARTMPVLRRARVGSPRGDGTQCPGQAARTRVGFSFLLFTQPDRSEGRGGGAAPGLRPGLSCPWAGPATCSSATPTRPAPPPGAPRKPRAVCGFRSGFQFPPRAPSSAPAGQRGGGPWRPWGGGSCRADAIGRGPRRRGGHWGRRPEARAWVRVPAPG